MLRIANGLWRIQCWLVRKKYTSYQVVGLRCLKLLWNLLTHQTGKKVLTLFIWKNSVLRSPCLFGCFLAYWMLNESYFNRKSISKTTFHKVTVFVMRRVHVLKKTKYLENTLLGGERIACILQFIFSLFSECDSYRVTKKTVITKNQITSKILFRLTQNSSYIRSSLCSRHLQSFKSVLQKLFASLALKKCATSELPGAGSTFGSGGQSSRWPSRIPPLG